MHAADRTKWNHDLPLKSLVLQGKAKGNTWVCTVLWRRTVQLTQNLLRMWRTLSQTFKRPQGRFCGVFLFITRVWNGPWSTAYLSNDFREKSVRQHWFLSSKLRSFCHIGSWLNRDITESLKLAGTSGENRVSYSRLLRVLSCSGLIIFKDGDSTVFVGSISLFENPHRENLFLMFKCFPVF